VSKISYSQTASQADTDRQEKTARWLNACCSEWRLVKQNRLTADWVASRSFNTDIVFLSEGVVLNVTSSVAAKVHAEQTGV